MSAAETHNRANLRMSSEESLAQFAEIVKVAEGTRVAINASISTAFGCPFDGPVSKERIFYIVERFIAMGITGVTLCDTTGMADPAQVFALCRAAGRRLRPPGSPSARRRRGRPVGSLPAWPARPGA